MSIVLFSMTLRIALAIAGIVFALAALGFVKRGFGRLGVASGVAAFAALGAHVVYHEPAVELRQVAREPNRIAVPIDDSKSMSLAEHADGLTRIERARRLLASSADTLTAWEADQKFDYYTFSDTLAETSLAALASDPAQGKSTMLRKALALLRGRYEGHDLAGIVLN